MARLNREDYAAIYGPTEGDQIRLRHRGDVDLADMNRPAFHAVQPAKQMQERALADTGGPNHRHHLATLDRTMRK